MKMRLARIGQAWLMVPLGRRIWKVPTWLAMRSALAVLAVRAVQFAPGAWSIRAAR
jgi:hypothetical protein